jgi:hypothetical protein
VLASWESRPERNLIALHDQQHPVHRVFMVTAVPCSGTCLDAVLQLLPAEPRQWLYPIRISCNHYSRCTEGTEQPLSQAQPADLQQSRQELTPISQH